ncbi:class I SAM-dependent methyltransferase [Hydrogenophaga sp. UC242_50]|uniref:class I SAM-dependent methyltransferase n=1 Tax=Hydrogenophaga sp. UC242_50 TaxID=3350169 RepID=UPI0036D312E2
MAVAGAARPPFCSPNTGPRPRPNAPSTNCTATPATTRATAPSWPRCAAPLLQRLAPGCSGLDYGCGPGPVLADLLREAGHTVALYDPFFHPDTGALATPHDFITCTEVAEHFHDPAAEFRRLDALLRPGGWLALMTRFQTDDARFAQWHYRRDPTHVVFYREATLRWLARHHGWHCEVPGANVVLMQKRPAPA